MFAPKEGEFLDVAVLTIGMNDVTAVGKRRTRSFLFGSEVVQFENLGKKS